MTGICVSSLQLQLIERNCITRPKRRIVQPLPPTNRLSPKNQVTLPRDAAALVGGPAHMRALPQRMPGRRERTLFHPVVVLMTEDGLRRRERLIIDDTTIVSADKTVLVQELNAGAVPLAIDDQRRVVIPAHLVEYLRLQRDALFVPTADLIYLWNPDEFRRWQEAVPPAGSLDLSRFIIV